MSVIGKVICPDCNGNGYVGSAKQPHECRDCSKCNNQGEIVITDEEIDKMLDAVENARLQ